MIATCFAVLLVGPLSAQSTTPTPSEQLRIQLPAEARDAINNGVKLVFDCHYASVRSLSIVSWRQNQQQHQFVVQRHSLSNRYIVRRDKLETPRIFRSLSEATTYISQQALLLLEFYSDSQQAQQLRLTLNKYALPGPMRLNAFIDDGWSIDSGWVLP